ncbi:MAG: hypothetical protein IPL65_18340 [Lewinellaceae bacterium]|nr:hypothetical protein [Lewinellaceae bacterium]
MVGYFPDTLRFRSDTVRMLFIQLQPEIKTIKEVTIKPKRYRNKDNPAVELIQQVIAHRDDNRVENLQTYQEEQYEKVLIGLSNLPEKVRNSKVLKSWAFALNNTDTSKLDDKSIVPLFLQENLQTFYSKSDPKISKKYISASKSVQFPGYLDQEGISKGLQYLNQDISLYDNYITLLTDHFMSPIANAAPLFYRYYPMDTLEMNGSKVVRLAFYPRNKTDMLLQGDLYVALDSTFPVTKAVFTVNPNINLNWVNTLDLAQEFARLPSGKWILSEEKYRLEFGLNKKGIGVYADRYVSHRDMRINPDLDDSIFKPADAVVYLPGALQQDSTFWTENRHTTLTQIEESTYVNMDSLQQTKLYKNTSKIALIAAVGYIPIKKTIEIGPISTLYAFNQVEGDRIRIGGRTASAFSTKFRVEGHVAYGFKDQRWKYDVGGVYALNGTAHNKFPTNLIRTKYSKDLTIPGQLLTQINANSILTSFVRGTNDRFLYTDRFNFQYEREFQNHFSYTAGIEHLELRPQERCLFIHRWKRRQPTRGDQ